MILVTGYTGQLGYDVVKELKKRKIECLGISSKELDITDKESVRNYLYNLKPQSIIHCAAYTSVDKAEDEQEVCYKVNVNGTENIAKAAGELGCKMMYISTDYVYGNDYDKILEVGDKIHPVCVYGKTKYNGEVKVKEYVNKYFILRVSWVFGINGENFVKTMIKLGKKQNSISVVSDQIGSPTYTYDLAKLMCDMIRTEKYGTYNVTNEGFCSWADFASEIMKQTNLKTKIKYISSDEYPAKAKRPLNSKMSKEMLIKHGFELLPNWKDALKRYIKELGEN